MPRRKSSKASITADTKILLRVAISTQAIPVCVIANSSAIDAARLACPDAFDTSSSGSPSIPHSRYRVSSFNRFLEPTSSPGRMAEHGVVQEPNRCQDRHRTIAASLQRGAASFQPWATDTDRVQTETVINQQPRAGYLLSNKWS